MSEVIDLLKYTQQKWSFLEKMFVQAPEVKKDLGVNAEEFVKHDEMMKKILKNGLKTPNLREFCKEKGLINTLTELKSALDD
jgi:hypothetical protein